MGIQIIPENRKPSTAEKFNAAFNTGMQQLGEYSQQKKQMQQMQQENQQIKQQLGIDLSGINDPKQRQEFVAQALRGRQEQEMQRQKLQGNFEIEKRDYDVIKNRFGDKFADVWRASDQGARTELVKQAIDSNLRAEDLNKMFKENEISEKPSIQGEISKTKPQMKDGKIPKDYEWPDFKKRPQGYNAKDWVDEMKTWRKENSPIFQEVNSRLKTHQRDELGIKNLTKLNKSGKVAEGFERLLINPETGEFYGLAQLAELPTKEAQEWVKEIARFQNRAKDAFGARVTNFDLQSYMKQFPGLLNSKEGRERILDMMSINNQLDQIYDKAITQIYKKYGLNGIPQEKAEELATQLIEDQTKELEDKYLQLDKANERQLSEDQKSKLSGRMVDVIGPDGQEYELDESELDELPEGYKIK